MKTQLPFWMKQTGLILLWGIVFYLAGLVSFTLDDSANSFAIIWFPSGVAVAAFLTIRWRDYPILLILFSLISVLFYPGIHNKYYLIMLLYGMLSIPSTLAIAWVVRRFAHLNDDLHAMLLWIGATLLLSLIDALIISSVFSYVNQTHFLRLFWYLLIANVSGIFFATTVIMGLINQHEYHRRPGYVRLFIGGFLWGAVCLVAWSIFSENVPWQLNQYTRVYFLLSCLPIVLTMMLSITLGNRGGSSALFALAAIVIYYTDQRSGPFFVSDLNYQDSLILAWCYLSAAALLVVFIRVMRHSTTRFDPDTGRIAGNGAIYRLQPETGWVTWDNKLSALLGSQVPSSLNSVASILQHVHPDDRYKLYQHWFSPAEENGTHMVFRLRDAKGEWRTLIDSGLVTVSFGTDTVLVGNWQISVYSE